ncbi:MAG: transporter substrate-binding domain-containing protein [Mycoplasmatales bacterium]
MKKIITVLTLSVLLLAGCSSSEDSNTFTVGLECDYAPYNWTTTEDKKSDYAVLVDGSKAAYCDGYDVRIAGGIAKELGKTLVVKKISWDGLIPAVQSGEIDAIIAGMAPTAERKQTIGFSDAYFKEQPIQGIMVQSTSELANAKSLNEFSNKKIAAQLGTLQERLIKQIPDRVETTSLDSYGALMQALQSGTIDGYAVEAVVGVQQSLETPGLSFITFDNGKGFEIAPEDSTTAIGVKKDATDFLESINGALQKINEDQRITWMKEATSKSDSE